MRDWPATLWRASFRGIPFFVESDEEGGGKRLAIHQFPGRDHPFIEDLGEDARTFEVEAYIVGDSSDGASSSLAANLIVPGAGTLVLPVQGQIQARLHKFHRSRSKDRMGFIAFSLSFVREGFATPFASALYLAQLVFDGVDGLAAAAVTLASRLDVRRQPGWIVADTVTFVQDIPATLETVRARAVIDPATSSSLKERLTENFNAVPAAVSRESGFDAGVIADAISIARDLREAMSPADAAGAFGAAIDGLVIPPVSGSTKNARTSAANLALARRLARLTVMAAYVEAVIARDYASRPDGVAARLEMVRRFGDDLSSCKGAGDADLYVALQDLRARAVEHLSSIIADLRPVVTVFSNEEMPALVLAWRLYQDPEKAGEIVARNKVKHPAWMPKRFSALAPSVVLPAAS